MLYDGPYCGQSLKQAQPSSPFAVNPRIRDYLVAGRSVPVIYQCPSCAGALLMNHSELPSWWNLGWSIAFFLLFFTSVPLLSIGKFRIDFLIVAAVQLLGNLWIQFWYLKSWPQYKKYEPVVLDQR